VLGFKELEYKPTDSNVRKNFTLLLASNLAAKTSLHNPANGPQYDDLA
tara:strand:+ start:167 stop:310 length:144 start_codon:yes stop_codon:yes gene_type:complete